MSDPQSSRRRWLRRLLSLLLALGAVYLLVAYALERDFKSAVESYSGPSLDMKDHLPTPLSPGQANGWNAVEATVLLIDGQRDRTQGSRTPNFTPSPELQEVYLRLRALEKEGKRPNAEDLAHWRDLAERYQAVFAVLDPAFAQAEEARYLTDYQVVPLEIEIPNLLASLRLTTLLQARAEIALAEGRAGDAWRDSKNIYRMAYWNATTMNTLIGGLVARAISHRGDVLVQTLLSEAPADAESRGQALNEARRLEPLRLFTELFAAERAASFSSLMDPRFQDALFLQAGPDPGSTRSLLHWNPYRKWLAGRYLQWSVASGAICEKPAYLQGDAAAQIAALALPVWAAPAINLTYDCQEASIKRDLMKASQDQLEIAMQLETYRQREGHYPRSLSEAGSDLESRLDPFSNQPYRYLPEGNGYRLYSLSANGKDDGGIEAQAQNNQPDFESGDWVWRVGQIRAP